MTPAERTAKIAELRAEPNDCSPFDGDESDFTYLGYARDLLAIKTPDAPEPTGAELVGKVCEFSDDGKTWVGKWLVRYYNPDAGYPYNWTHDRPFRYARLYREDRP